MIIALDKYGKFKTGTRCTKQSIASLREGNDLVGHFPIHLEDIAQLSADHGELVARHHIPLIIDHTYLPVSCILHLVDDALEHSV